MSQRNYEFKEAVQGQSRCRWCTEAPLYQQYHDNEWGRLEEAEEKIFEQLLLETQQAGLSWWTVLKKREAYRQAFYQFEPEKIARIGPEELEELLQNRGLIRHRQKLESIVENARAYLRFRQREGLLRDWLREEMKQFYNMKAFTPQLNIYKSGEMPPNRTEFSDHLARQLKREGFKRLGSVTLYAFLQAIGMINDHTRECYLYPEKILKKELSNRGLR